MNLEILEQRSLPADLSRLVEVGTREGYAFLSRFVSEWETGQNQFDEPGEVLLFAYRAGTLVGFGGLNRDPYQSHASVGRVRHVYVEPKARGEDVGSALVRELVRRAHSTFQKLRLTTDHAGRFYERLGFETVSEHKATHVLELATDATP
ncbi:MAG: GNAT family N-acetyltransferase [Planctomycetota bacterium]